MIDIQELLDHVDLRALAEEAGATFGHNNASTCPLHPGADNPSAFHIYRRHDGRWCWHCFTRCPEGANGGDAIAFYMRWRDVDFKTAVRELARRAGLDPRHLDPPRPAPRPDPSPPSPFSPPPDPPADPWQARASAFLLYAQRQLWGVAGRPVLGYLHAERGLVDDTIRRWGLGYNPHDVWDDPDAWGLQPGQKGKRIWCPRGVVIPGRDPQATWYVKVRRPLPGDALARAIGPVQRLERMKFSGPRGGRATLFGADHLAGRPVLLLVEGEFDALLAWQAAADLCDVVSLGGARHKLNAAVAAVLARACTILAAYDLDVAGGHGNDYLRSVSQRVTVVQPPDHDLTDYWRHGGNLRAWIATHVAEHMERLLSDLDDRRHPELFVNWLNLYEQTLAVVEHTDADLRTH